MSSSSSPSSPTTAPPSASGTPFSALLVTSSAASNASAANATAHSSMLRSASVLLSSAVLQASPSPTTTAAAASDSTGAPSYTPIIVAVVAAVAILVIVMVIVRCRIRVRGGDNDIDGPAAGDDIDNDMANVLSNSSGSVRRPASSLHGGYQTEDDLKRLSDPPSRSSKAGLDGPLSMSTRMVETDAGLGLAPRRPLDRSSSIRSRHEQPLDSPQSVLDSFYTPPANMQVTRSRSLSNIGYGYTDELPSSGELSSVAMPPAMPAFSRRPSLQDRSNSRAFPTTFAPSNGIELISAYKDSDLAERAFEIQRQHSLLQQQHQVQQNDANQMFSPTVASSAASLQRSSSLSHSVTTNGRRPSAGSIHSTTGSLFFDDAAASVGPSVPDLDSFSVSLDTERWIFARREAVTKMDTPAVATLIGGSTAVAGGGWGFMHERRGSTSALLQTAGAAVTLDSATGKVVLAAATIDGDGGSTPLPDNASAMASQLSRHNSTASSLSTMMSSRKSVKEQVAISVLSWRNTTLARHQQDIANAMLQGSGSTIGQKARLLKLSPMRHLVVAGERRDPWPTFVNGFCQTMSALVDHFDHAAQQQQHQPMQSITLVPTTTGSLRGTGGPRPRLQMPLAHATNDAIQEFCVTVNTLNKSATPIPCRIGYEPRAFNEVALKRNDVIVLFAAFDNDFGFGLNRTNGELGFINLGHLDPKRLANAFEPNPLPLPLPTLPSHIRAGMVSPMISSASSLLMPASLQVQQQQMISSANSLHVPPNLSMIPGPGSSAAFVHSTSTTPVVASQPPPPLPPQQHQQPPQPVGILRNASQSSTSRPFLPSSRSPSSSSQSRTNTPEKGAASTLGNLLEMLDHSATLNMHQNNHHHHSNNNNNNNHPQNVMSTVVPDDGQLWPEGSSSSSGIGAPISDIGSLTRGTDSDLND